MRNRISTDEEPERTTHHVKEVMLRCRAGDLEAKNELHEMFKPLIHKETSRIYIQTILGEDAENIAWAIFYEFVDGYTGNRFSTFPGLIKKVLKARLINETRKVTGHTTYNLEDMTEEEHLKYASYSNDIANLELNIMLKDAIKKLPLKQQAIIYEIVMQGRPPEEFCSRHNEKVKNVYNEKKRALDKLEEILTKAGFVRKNNTRKSFKKSSKKASSKKPSSNNFSK